MTTIPQQVSTQLDKFDSQKHFLKLDAKTGGVKAVSKRGLSGLFSRFDRAVNGSQYNVEKIAIRLLASGQINHQGTVAFRKKCAASAQARGSKTHDVASRILILADGQSSEVFKHAVRVYFKDHAEIKQINAELDKRGDGKLTSPNQKVRAFVTNKVSKVQAIFNVFFAGCHTEMTNERDLERLFDVVKTGAKLYSKYTQPSKFTTELCYEYCIPCMVS